jgi:valyl-tRNA synthetase
VAVHPDDARYTSFVGRSVLIPFVDRVVPIIADDCRAPGLRHRRGEDHARHDQTTSRPASATACRSSTS